MVVSQFLLERARHIFIFVCEDIKVFCPQPRLYKYFILCDYKVNENIFCKSTLNNCSFLKVLSPLNKMYTLPTPNAFIQCMCLQKVTLSMIIARLFDMDLSPSFNYLLSSSSLAYREIFCYFETLQILQFYPIFLCQPQNCSGTNGPVVRYNSRREHGRTCLLRPRPLFNILFM